MNEKKQMNEKVSLERVYFHIIPGDHSSGSRLLLSPPGRTNKASSQVH